MAIFSNGVKISKSGKRLVFERGDKKSSLLVSYIRGILVFGKVSLSGDSINLLLAEGIPVFFLTRFGRFKGMLFKEYLPSNYNTRLVQYNLYTTKRVEAAKFFVLKKLEEIEKVFLISLEEEKKLLREAQDLDTVRGIEGTASRKMFNEIKKELEGSEFLFKGREYNPPPDEVNALLSLTYTMVYLTSLPVVITLGYDPYIGYLHSKRGTHAAFCSDLMEPARPFITYLLVQEIKRNLFSKKDFEITKGVYLKESALSRFLNWYERQADNVLKKLSQTLAEFNVEFA